MAKRILKAREVDRLENTTFVTTIAVAGDNRQLDCAALSCNDCNGGTCTNVIVGVDCGVLSCNDCNGGTCTNVVVGVGTGTRTIDSIAAIRVLGGVGAGIGYRA